MDESGTERLTQLLADEHLNTSLNLLVNHLPDRDRDRDSSTSVGPTGQARFHHTQSPAMSHHLNGTRRLQEPHGSGAEPGPEDPVHAVIGTVSFMSRRGVYAVANAL